MKEKYDCIIIGGGPAGLAAAITTAKEGLEALIIEREASLGGILKQCIHDGFGLTRYGEKLTGPEYAARDIEAVRTLGIDELCSTFVLDVRKIADKDFVLTISKRDGISQVHASSLILAMGCRERTAKQVFIHGTRPAGVFTAGCAQNLVNIQGLLPSKRCVILGSGDIGLIMARRLSLEGCSVLGVYEIQPRPSGLRRNIEQCLNDYNIPLHLSKTVTRVFGRDRLEAVEICDVDSRLKPIEGTEERIECDALILSVGLIPENELSERLRIKIDPRSKGPVVDEHLMTSCEGVFAAGNCLKVYDLVDSVSVVGSDAGAAAAAYVRGSDMPAAHDIPGAADKAPLDTPQPADGEKMLTCTLCPNGCTLYVDSAGNVRGNRCKRGPLWAKQELERPMRILSSTVRTTLPGHPVLAVRTDGELPRDILGEAIKEINRVTVKSPVGIGDVIISNICGTGVNVIAISNELKEQ